MKERSKSLMTGIPFALLPLCLLLVTLVSGCGDGGDGTPPPPSYVVGGSVAGLVSGTSLVLQNSAGNDTSISVNASFSFSTGLPAGAAYSVTVLTQPVGEACTVANSSGTIGNANVSVAVVCTPNKYTIAGSVSGLAAGMVLPLTDNNGALSASATTNGSFAFSPAQPSGSAYAVTIAPGEQPTGQNCTVANGSGTLSGANVSNIAITCVTLDYQVSVTVMGLQNVTGLTLQDNGTDNLSVTSSGTSPFAIAIPNGSDYGVTVLSQPPGVTCSVAQGTGAVNGANVNVLVTCPWEAAYLGEISGVIGGTFYLDEATGMLFGYDVPAVQAQSSAGTLTSMAIDPLGSFVFLGLEDFSLSSPASTILAYKVDPATGNLLTIAGSPYTIAGTSNTFINAIFEAQTNLLFAFDVYHVDTATGALTPYVGTPPATPPNPPTIAVEPSGSYEYAVVGDAISASSIDPTTGAQTPVTGSPFSLNQGVCTPSVITVDPSEKYVYAICNTLGPSGLTGFAINASTGMLTPIEGLPPVTGNSAIVIAALD